MREPVPVNVARWLVLAGMLVGGLATSSTVARADDVAISGTHPIVAGFERFHTDGQADMMAGGRLLLGELGCTACHAANAQAASHVIQKQAPILDHVGGRVRPEYLRQFLADPQKVKPGTTMPNLLGAMPAAEMERQIEALVHLFASTGDIQEAAPNTAAVKRGEALFHTVGCVACHNPRTDGAPQLATSVPLPPVMEAKYSVLGLAAFLADPLHVRPAGRMPDLNLTPEESRDLACYLLRDLEIEGTLEFAYYEGSWQTLPDFRRLTSKSKGLATSFDVNVGAKDHFGLVFDGLFRVARAGTYRFYLGSDDGSRLSINGKPLIEQDGIHPLSFGNQTIELQAGVQEIRVEYFEQGGEQELRVEFEGPDIKRMSVEFALVPSSDEAASDERLVVDAKLAAEGARIFSSLGCASCHQLQTAGASKPLVAQRTAKPLVSLKLPAPNPETDCLTNVGRQGTPNYGLTANQSQSLFAAIKGLRMPNAPSESDVVAQTLTAFNCRSCHVRDKLGGVEAARNASFQSNQPEMGDEGRIPPPLDCVGAKLQAAWLRHVFNNGAKDRPYMFTRMPRFGEPNVGQLVTALEAADAPESTPPFNSEIPDRRLKAAGRRLVGAQGFSCIKCHTWGNVKATGIQSIGMTTMTRRLRRSWFVPYLLDPQAYRPGTRMPAAWPQGQVLLPKLLDGKAETQIQAVWEYLSDGDQAPRPTGLDGSPIELVPVDEPVLYRNFIQDAGPRAIGVGYPERVNLAFDANNLRLALIWHNGFIDAAKHWQGRGPGFQTPLGDNVLKLTDGAPLATLADPNAVWPRESAKQLGHRFLGYRLDDRRRPVFLYRRGDVQVEDYFEPVGDQEFAPLRRTIQFSAPSAREDLWFRALVASSIEETDVGTFEIDGQWTLKLTVSSGEPRIRKASGKTELIVPVLPGSGRQTVTQEFIW